MNTMKKAILLLALFGALATSLAAQERLGEPSFLPATGVGVVDDYMVIWESGTLSRGQILSADGKIALIAGVGTTLGGFVDLPADNTNPNVDPGGGAVESATLYEITAYPNPAREFVELNLGKIEGSVHVDLFNALGVRVSHLVADAEAIVRLPVDNLVNGLYIVRVTRPEGGLLAITRLTVQR